MRFINARGLASGFTDYWYLPLYVLRGQVPEEGQESSRATGFLDKFATNCVGLQILAPSSQHAGLTFLSLLASETRTSTSAVDGYLGAQLKRQTKKRWNSNLILEDESGDYPHVTVVTCVDCVVDSPDTVLLAELSVILSIIRNRMRQEGFNKKAVYPVCVELHIL